MEESFKGRKIQSHLFPNFPYVLSPLFSPEAEESSALRENASPFPPAKIPKGLILRMELQSSLYLFISKFLTQEYALIWKHNF